MILVWNEVLLHKDKTIKIIYHMRILILDIEYNKNKAHIQ